MLRPTKILLPDVAPGQDFAGTSHFERRIFDETGQLHLCREPWTWVSEFVVLTTWSETRVPERAKYPRLVPNRLFPISFVAEHPGSFNMFSEGHAVVGRNKDARRGILR